MNYFVVLRQHQWLLVRQRIMFKIAAGLVHQSLVGAASVYLADDCRLRRTSPIAV